MKRILLAMRDSPPRARLSQALELRDMTVTTVDSGEQAIDRFITETFDILIVQLDLPGRDGVATIESIRWAPGGTAIPTVLIGEATEPLAMLEERLDVPALNQHDAEGIAHRLANQRPIAEITREIPAPATAFQTVNLDSASEPPSITGHTGPSVYIAPQSEETTSALKAPPNDPPSVDEAKEVEARATSVAGRARLSGGFRETPFAHVLARLAEQHATGALIAESSDDPRRRLTGASAKKLVFVRRGVPVFIQSNLEEECLGQQLLREGAITREQLNESVQRVLAGDGKQGGILIAMGALDPSRLRSGLESEMLTKLLDLFAWEEGTFHFAETAPPPPTTVSLEVPLSGLMLRGLREQMSIERIFEALAPHAKRYVTPTSRGANSLRAALDDGGNRLLAAIDGTMTVETMVDSGQPSRPEAARILYAAEALGVVAFRDQAALAAFDDRDAEDEHSALQSRVLWLAQHLKDGRYSEALGVRPGDGVGAARAVADIEASLQPAIDAESSPASIRSAALEVLARLPRAALAVGAEASGAQAPSSPLPSPATGGPLPSLPPLAPQDRLDERVSRMLQAERHFRQARRLSDRRRRAQALDLYKKAVELAPDEGEFVAYLGMARYDAAIEKPERERALSELKQATLLVPKMYRAHLFLARALRDEGEFRLARDAYARALEADPSGVEALDELHNLPA